MAGNAFIVEYLSNFIRFQEPVDLRRDDIPGYCPFHKGGMESSPSFYLYIGPTLSLKKSTGSAFCQTCGTGWTLRTLLTKVCGISRAKADNIMSDMDITIPDDVFIDPFLQLPSNPQREVPEKVLGFLDYCPKPLLSEGFSKQTLKEFDIGFDTRNARITFPIRDEAGRLVGISGRTVIGSSIRYKIYTRELGIHNNSLEKHRVVWNLHRAKSFIKYGEPIVLHEGFKAVMWSHQNGVKTTVCPLGTHVSDEQLVLLSNTTDQLVLFLDGDSPGIKATQGVALKLKDHFNLRFVCYPEDKQGCSPDDLTREETHDCIRKACDAVQWAETTLGNRQVDHFLKQWTKPKR